MNRGLSAPVHPPAFDWAPVMKAAGDFLFLVFAVLTLLAGVYVVSFLIAKGVKDGSA